ncbi:MAG: M48 family metalloprotease [Prochloraceae cyanobacterium]|nr:M48 family metalloprotease [Prochloraceae cyanobacterium]
MKILRNSLIILILVANPGILAGSLKSSQLRAEELPNSAESVRKTEESAARESEATPTEESAARESEATPTEESAARESEAIPTEESAARESEATPTEEKSELTPEQQEKYQKLQEADRLYLAGDKVAAANLYREAKEAFAAEELQESEKAKPIYEPKELKPAGAVYWRLYQEGLDKPHLKSKTLVPLQLLVEEHSHFIPGHLHYAETLEQYEEEEKALEVLQIATALYPSEAQLAQAAIEAHEDRRNFLEASIIARRFALFNPDSPQIEEFIETAEQNLQLYENDLKEQLRLGTIGNAAFGALSFFLTGSLYGPLSAVETTVLMLRGESGVGDRMSKNMQKRLRLMKDKKVLEYVREIGDKLAAVTGRDEFEYEFYIVMDDSINAFALPGGKIFINAGAILKTESEAELAGLLAHELSHSVLSHGFQMITEGALTANSIGFIPYIGGIASNLMVLNYSREMETEADIFGTRILVAAGYAADGVRNLMATIAEEKNSAPPAWLSTHPHTHDRVSYIEEFIVSNKLNRYAYEGVSRHSEIQEKVAKLWEGYKKTEDYRRRYRNRRKK